MADSRIECLQPARYLGLTIANILMGACLHLEPGDTTLLELSRLTLSVTGTCCMSCAEQRGFPSSVLLGCAKYPLHSSNTACLLLMETSPGKHTAPAPSGPKSGRQGKSSAPPVPQPPQSAAAAPTSRNTITAPATVSNAATGTDSQSASSTLYATLDASILDGPLSRAFKV